MTAYYLLFLLADGGIYATPVPTQAQCWADRTLSYAAMYQHTVNTRMRGQIIAPNGVPIAIGWSVACVEWDIPTGKA